MEIFELQNQTTEKYYADFENLNKLWDCISLNEGYMTEHCIINTAFNLTERASFPNRDRESIKPGFSFLYNQGHTKKYFNCLRYPDMDVFGVVNKNSITNRNYITPSNFISFKRDNLKSKSTILVDLNFVYRLKEKDQQDEFKAIDDLYEHVDNLIESNAFFRIDRLINFIINKDFKLRLLIALLTITHSKKDFLRNRRKIIEAARISCIKQNLSPNQITSILKGF
jgi:hypothetical protein